MKRFKHLGTDRRGVAVAEYGLIAAVAGVVIAVAALAFGPAATSELRAASPCAQSEPC